MQINTLLKQLETFLIANKWIVKEKSLYYIKFNNIELFDDTITFDLPINSDARDFVKQLSYSIDILIQIQKSWEKDPFIKYVRQYLIKYQLQFSKQKKDWIIPEPDSKYTENEIPSIYIP